MDINRDFARFLNSTQPAVDQEHMQNQQVANGFRAGSTGYSHAMLYLIAPRSMIDQTIRPVVYNFNSGFCDDVCNFIDRQATVPYNAMGNLRDTFINSSYNAQAAVVPSTSDAFKVNMQPYAASWTFLLIVDNETSTGAIPGAIGSFPSRELYSGVVASSNEPATKDFTGNWVINPNVIFTIHHASKNAVSNMEGRGGRIINDLDVDILHRSQMLAIDNPKSSQNDPNFYSLDKEDVGAASIINTTCADAGMPISPMGQDPNMPYNPNLPGPADIPYGEPIFSHEDVKVTDTSAKCYSQQLNNIVGGISTMADSAITSDRGGLSDNVFGPFSHNSTEFTSKLASAISAGPVRVPMSFDAKEVLTMDDLERRFGNALDVGIIEAPYEVGHDRDVTNEPTPRNIAYAIMAAALPSALARWCLAELSFAYDTTNIDPMTNRVADPLVLGCGSIHPYGCPDKEARMCLDWLVNTALRKVYSICGNFGVVCYAQIAGHNIMSFHMYDHNCGIYQNNNAFLETSSLVDSLNTNLIGTADNLKFNANNFANLAYRTFGEVGKASNDFHRLYPELTGLNRFEPDPYATPAPSSIDGDVNLDDRNLF